MSAAAGVYTGLGWRWRQLSARGLPHLVPQTVLARSRTACHLPLHGVLLLEPLSLFGEARCASCLRANGGVA